MSLYGRDGRRKYLTAEKRAAFLKSTESAERDVRTFCALLAYSGCRISEALTITADRVDLVAGLVVLECLKKRHPGVYRAAPLPPALLDALDLAHGLRKVQRRADGGKGVVLWP